MRDHAWLALSLTLFGCSGTVPLGDGPSPGSDAGNDAGQQSHQDASSGASTDAGHGASSEDASTKPDASSGQQGADAGDAACTLGPDPLPCQEESTCTPYNAICSQANGVCTCHASTGPGGNDAGSSHGSGGSGPGGNDAGGCHLGPDPLPCQNDQICVQYGARCDVNASSCKCP